MSEDQMPLDPELLEMERELRTLVPLEMDIATAQRLTRALESDLPADPHGLHASGARVVAMRSALWRRSWPWAAAAGVAAAGMVWTSGPWAPGARSLAAASDHAPARASVREPFPDRNPASASSLIPAMAELDGVLTDEHAPQPTRRTPSPEATSPHGFLNVMVVELPAPYCQSQGIAGGVWVQAMGAAGPAARQGVHVGDIILLVDGKPVGTADNFVGTIRNTAPGTELTLTLLRGDKILKIPVRLGCAPSV
jgi:hypothetical protein